MKEKSMPLLRHFVAIILVFCCTITMSACSLSDIAKIFSDFDASAYTQAFLDAISKNEFTEYADITNSTEEEAKKEYESLLDSSVSSLLASITVSDETKQQVRDMFHDIYSKWNYSVGEAVKNDDKSFTVPVTVKKLTVFKGVLKETVTRFEKRTKNSKNMNDSAYYDLYYQTFIELVNENLAKGKYGDETVVQVSVKPTTSNSNIYEIASESITALYNATMDMDVLQKEAASIASMD